MITLSSELRRWTNKLVKGLLEVFVINRKARRVYRGIYAQHQLKAYLQPLEFRPLQPSLNLPIWQYWDGNKMPLEVSGCLASVERYYPERRLLNLKTLEHYVSLPGFYYDYLRNGKIKLANFSDVVRLYLLKEHGGTWLDATLYLTDIFPTWLRESPIFWLQTREEENLDNLSLTNYFLHAFPKHPILESLAAALDLYWQKNDFSINYFSFLHLLTLLARTEAGKNYLKTMPYLSFEGIEKLQWELLQPYTTERWQQLKRISFIHKLSYKPKVLGLKPDQSLKGTFYEYLFNRP